MNFTYRIERPLRIALWVVVAMWGLFLLTFLAHWGDLGPYPWVMIGVPLLIVLACARGLFLRVETDFDGVRFVNFWRRGRIAWDTVDRVEVTAWFGYVCVVTTDGTRRRFTLGRRTPLERMQDGPNGLFKGLERALDARRSADAYATRHPL
jgi:hypothetical protein